MKSHFRSELCTQGATNFGASNRRDPEIPDETQVFEIFKTPGFSWVLLGFPGFLRVSFWKTKLSSISQLRPAAQPNSPSETGAVAHALNYRPLSARATRLDDHQQSPINHQLVYDHRPPN